MIGLTKIHTLRIVYKSGYTHDFDVTKYSISTDKMSWICADVKNQPLNMGMDEISAVWKVGEHRRFFKWL